MACPKYVYKYGTVLAAIIAGFSLSSCSTTPVSVCPPLKTYPPEFSQRLANEMEAMPSDSATAEAIGDYMGLRDAIRACQ